MNRVFIFFKYFLEDCFKYFAHLKYQNLDNSNSNIFLRKISLRANQKKEELNRF